MLNGVVYQRKPLKLCTKEIGFGLLPIPTVRLSLPTPVATEGRGSSRKRFKGSKDYRGSKTSEGLRICKTDPMYLNPLFAEWLMALPLGWTDLNVSVTGSFRLAPISLED